MQNTAGEGRTREQEKKENFSLSPFPFRALPRQIPQHASLLILFRTSYFVEGVICSGTYIFAIYSRRGECPRGHEIRPGRPPNTGLSAARTQSSSLLPFFPPSFCGRTPNFAALRLAAPNGGRTRPAPWPPPPPLPLPRAPLLI